MWWRSCCHVICEEPPIMKRQKFNRRRFFHFTTHFAHPEWYESSPGQNWKLLIKCLNRMGAHPETEDIVWHSAVLMSNHIHLLFSMNSFGEHSLVLELESCLQAELGLRGKLFQRPLPCEPLLHLEHLRQAYKYIYRNPVEAGLARRVEDYPLSSLRLLLNRDREMTQHCFVDPFPSVLDLSKHLKWLNSTEAWAWGFGWPHDFGPSIDVST
jgi:putative transposase